MIKKVIWSQVSEPPGEGNATHSSSLAWEIPWTKEPGRLQSMGSWKTQTRLSDSTTTIRNLLELSWARREWGRVTVYTTWIKEFLTVPKEQPTRLSRRMNTLSPLPETRGLPPASSVSLLSFSLCVAFTASPRHQLSVYMLLALGNTQLSQKPNSKFPGLSQVSNELFLVQITTAKRHSSSTPQT